MTEDRTAIVTGGGRGLGAAICEALAGRGLRVAPMARTEDQVIQVAERIDGLPLVADVTRADQVRAAVSSIEQVWGRLDVVVNNAGASTPRSDIEELAAGEWERVIGINITGAFHVVQAAAAGLRHSPAGRVINISSIAGVQPMPRMAPYATSKSAMLGFTKTLARELAPRCTVNAVAPGYVNVGIGESVLRDESYREFVLQRTPVGRFGQPEEIGDLVGYLVSRRAGFITGQIITIDGGWTLV